MRGVVFLSTPSGWRATQRDFFSHGQTLIISIHALRVEGDNDVEKALQAGYISIHALRVEGDPAKYGDHVITALFLSTPSGWRATPPAFFHLYPLAFLSTPSGWRATIFTCNRIFAIFAFLSTPSGWRATRCCKRSSFRQCVISIHALRVEGDRRVCRGRYMRAKISIHALRVEGDAI